MLWHSPHLCVMTCSGMPVFYVHSLAHPRALLGSDYGTQWANGAYIAVVAEGKLVPKKLHQELRHRRLREEDFESGGHTSRCCAPPLTHTWAGIFSGARALTIREASLLQGSAVASDGMLHALDKQLRDRRGKPMQRRALFRLVYNSLGQMVVTQLGAAVGYWVSAALGRTVRRCPYCGQCGEGARHHTHAGERTGNKPATTYHTLGCPGVATPLVGAAVLGWGYNYLGSIAGFPVYGLTSFNTADTRENVAYSAFFNTAAPTPVFNHTIPFMPSDSQGDAVVGKRVWVWMLAPPNQKEIPSQWYPGTVTRYACFAPPAPAPHDTGGACSYDVDSCHHTIEYDDGDDSAATMLLLREEQWELITDEGAPPPAPVSTASPTKKQNKWQAPGKQKRPRPGVALPAGWFVETKVRGGGATEGRVDKYYRGPNGEKFDSYVKARAAFSPG